MLSENIWFTKCKPSNYSIFGKGTSYDVQTNRQVNRISNLRLGPFCGRGRVKIRYLFIELEIYAFKVEYPP